jgi:translation initiation factor 2A
MGVRRCKQVADLGAGPHNLARFSRFGRFLALAGFGNLPGDLVIHERKADAKWKQLATTR